MTPLDPFARRALSLSLVAHGLNSVDDLVRLAHHFFLVHAPTAAYRALGPTEKRQCGSDGKSGSGSSELDELDELDEGERAMIALPIAARPASCNPVITVGRLNGNDVFLADASVSKYHAFLRDDDGRLLLSDANSRNGTTVNGASVPTRGRGGVVLRVGDVVTFGQLRAHIVDARGLFAFARGLTNTLSPAP